MTLGPKILINVFEGFIGAYLSPQKFVFVISNKNNKILCTL
jgi:hypothetical protein